MASLHLGLLLEIVWRGDWGDGGECLGCHIDQGKCGIALGVIATNWWMKGHSPHYYSGLGGRGTTTTNDWCITSGNRVLFPIYGIITVH